MAGHQDSTTFAFDRVELCWPVLFHVEPLIAAHHAKPGRWRWVTNQPMAVRIIGGVIATLLASGMAAWPPTHAGSGGPRPIRHLRSSVPLGRLGHAVRRLGA